MATGKALHMSVPYVSVFCHPHRGWEKQRNFTRKEEQEQEK
jgi:hypothetical protein